MGEEGGKSVSSGHAGTDAPLYRRIASDLWEQIQSGDLAPGQQMPSELQLSATYGVNRLTVRQAITELQRLGVIEIRRGTGTFVTAPPDLVEFVATVPSTAQHDDATHHALADGGRPGQVSAKHVVEHVITDAQTNGPHRAAAAEYLARDAGQLTQLDTVMRRDGTPWIVNTYWFAPGAEGVTRLLPDHKLVVLALVQGLGLELVYQWRAFSAVAADFDESRHLGVAAGTALLVRDGVTATAGGAPVFYVRRRMRGDTAKFVLRYES